MYGSDQYTAVEELRELVNKNMRTINENRIAGREILILAHKLLDQERREIDGRQEIGELRREIMKQAKQIETTTWELEERGNLMGKKIDLVEMAIINIRQAPSANEIKISRQPGAPGMGFNMVIWQTPEDQGKEQTDNMHHTYIQNSIKDIVNASERKIQRDWKTWSDDLRKAVNSDVAQQLSKTTMTKEKDSTPKWIEDLQHRNWEKVSPVRMTAL